MAHEHLEHPYPQDLDLLESDLGIENNHQQDYSDSEEDYGEPEKSPIIFRYLKNNINQMEFDKQNNDPTPSPSPDQGNKGSSLPDFGTTGNALFGVGVVSYMLLGCIVYKKMCNFCPEKPKLNCLFSVVAGIVFAPAQILKLCCCSKMPKGYNKPPSASEYDRAYQGVLANKIAGAAPCPRDLAIINQ